MKMINILENDSFQINEFIPRRKRDITRQFGFSGTLRSDFIKGRRRPRPSRIYGPKFHFYQEMQSYDYSEHMKRPLWRENMEQRSRFQEERCRCQLFSEKANYNKVSRIQSQRNSPEKRRKSYENGVKIQSHKSTLSAPHNTTQFIMKDLEQRYNSVDENKLNLLSSSDGILPSEKRPNYDQITTTSLSSEMLGNSIIERPLFKMIPLVFDEEYAKMDFEELYSAACLKKEERFSA